MTDPNDRPETSNVEVTADAILVEGEAEGVQTFSPERGAHEIKASREAHRQRVELQRLENELRENERRLESDLRDAETSKTFRRRILGIAFGAGLLIVVGGIGVGFAMAVWANDQGTRDFGKQLALLLVGTVAGAWAGFFAGSKFG